MKTRRQKRKRIQLHTKQSFKKFGHLPHISFIPKPSHFEIIDNSNLFAHYHYYMSTAPSRKNIKLIVNGVEQNER